MGGGQRRPAPARNYGWNVREGNCVRDSSTDCGPPPAGMTNPIYSYNHIDRLHRRSPPLTSCPNGLWPASTTADYLFGDLVCRKLWRLEPDGSGGYTRREFASGIPWLIDGVFGPNGAVAGLLLHQLGRLPERRDPQDRLHRHGNQTAARARQRRPDLRQPAARRSTSTARGSSDPDDDPLTYDWDFGDGSPHSSAATPNHTYTTAGNYTRR